jgi:regulator of replication initiation timing
MHYIALVHKYKFSNPVVKKMIMCGKQAWGISDDLVDLRLKEWSKAIQEDFDAKKVSVTMDRQGNEVLERIQAIHHHQGSHLVALQSSVGQLAQDNVRLRLENQALHHKIDTLIHQQNDMKAMMQQLLLQQASSQAAVVAPSNTPDAQSIVTTTGKASTATPCSIPITASPAHPLGGSVLPQDKDTHQSFTNASPLATAPPQASVFQTLMFNSKINKGGVTEPSGKSIPVSDVLMELFTTGRLQNLETLRNLKVDKFVPKGQGGYVVKYEAAMDLVDCLWTADERDLAKSCDKTKDKTAQELFLAMNERVMDAIAVLAGKTDRVSSARANYLGIGNSLNKDNKLLRSMLHPWRPAWMTWPQGVGQSSRPGDAEDHETLKDYVARKISPRKRKR